MKEATLYAVVLENRKGLYEFVGDYLYKDIRTAYETAKQMSEEMNKYFTIKEFEVAK